MKHPVSNTLSCLVPRFLEEGTRDQKDRPYLPSTLRTWGPNLRAFLRWLEERVAGPPTLSHWTRPHLLAYKEFLDTKPTLPGKGKSSGGLRPRTIHSHFAAMGAFERFCCDNKLLSAPVVASIPLPAFDEARQALLLEREVHAILEACDRLYPARHRLLATAVISVFFCTALRYEDVRSLRLRDVKIGATPDECFLIAEHSKGDKEHRAFLPPETVEAIAAWMRERETIRCAPENDWLWAITRTRRIGEGWWKELRAEIEHLSGLSFGDRFQAHAARRAAATHMEDEGMPISLIQEALGHENIETTIIYLNKSRRRRAENAHRQGWRKPGPEPQEPQISQTGEQNVPTASDARPPLQKEEERTRRINPFQRGRFLDRR